MKKQFIFLLVFLLGIQLASAGCPFCHGGVVKYCHVEITPEPLVYGQEMVLNVTVRLLDQYQPIDEGTEVEIWYYNASGNLTKVELETDSEGIVRYSPELVGYHLIKTCEKNILMYVNSTCGDGVCAGGESRIDCAEDCGDCGDGVCDSNEDLDCQDCAVCGDKKCTSGETRGSCLKDCVICGDGICDYLENRQTCADDCLSGEVDTYCDGEADNICDPDCEEDEDPDCKVEEETIAEVKPVVKVEKADNTVLYMVLVVIIFAIIISAVLIKKKSNKKKNVESSSASEKKESKSNEKAKKTPQASPKKALAP